MQELERELKEMEDPDHEIDDFHNAGKKWAAHALDTYTDEYLEKALQISVAIADFTAALKRPID
jgi:hypothetical protein